VMITGFASSAGVGEGYLADSRKLPGVKSDESKIILPSRSLSLLIGGFFPSFLQEANRMTAILCIRAIPQYRKKKLNDRLNEECTPGELFNWSFGGKLFPLRCKGTLSHKSGSLYFRF
jgi:hypothetical protein